MEKSEKNILAVLVLNCCLLCVGHAFSVFALVAISLAVYLLLVVRSGHRLFVPIALFFIPFARLLRFNIDSFSFFSLGIILFFFWEICFRTNRLKYLPKNLLAAIAGICIYIIALGFFRGTFPNISLLMTLCQFVMVPLIAFHCRDKISFRPCVIYFVTGVLLACVLSLVFQDYAGMKPFIEVDQTDVIDADRICGFTGDGNRMGAQTLAAMCAVMVLQLIDRGKKLTRYVLLLTALLLCGVLTVSKMFLLEAAFLMMLWCVAFFCQRGLVRKKIALVMGMVAVICIVLGSGILNTQIDIYIRRFSLAEDASSFTTGRTDIWKIYLDYLLEKIDVLLIGKGWMSEYLYFMEQSRNVAPHNILFEVLYRLGIIGAAFLVGWIVITCRGSMPLDYNKKYIPGLVRLIVGIGFFAPWLAIPAIDFDEFFFFPLLAMYAFYDYAKNARRDLQESRG